MAQACFFMLLRRPIHHGVIKATRHMSGMTGGVRGYLIGLPLGNFGTEGLSENFHVFRARGL